MVRPRRRASQTYFFKYQLARNPLKAEEEDLKYAIMASLQQCNNSNNRSKRPAAKKAKLIARTLDPPPPDEEYVNKYKPETEDFLTFICYRNLPLAEPTSQRPTTNGRELNGGSQSPTRNHHRRPIRQSPRLANSNNRKISENESSSNLNIGSSSTAYENSTTYEEDMKRASIALEDMAHEINSSDGIKDELAQESPGCISNKILSSPYKNNKHLVKGLMTREFAGAFADEDTIFESISNHKL